MYRRRRRCRPNAVRARRRPWRIAGRPVLEPVGGVEETVGVSGGQGGGVLEGGGGAGPVDLIGEFEKIKLRPCCSLTCPGQAAGTPRLMF